MKLCISQLAIKWPYFCWENFCTTFLHQRYALNCSRLFSSCSSWWISVKKKNICYKQSSKWKVTSKYWNRNYHKSYCATSGLSWCANQTKVFPLFAFFHRSANKLSRTLFFLQCPLFEYVPSFIVFAHLLRCIASLTDYDHHFLVHWLRPYVWSCFFMPSHFLLYSSVCVCVCVFLHRCTLCCKQPFSNNHALCTHHTS